MNAIHNLAELRSVAFNVLVRELGYANAVRFMLQYERGDGDYSRDRTKLLPALSVDDWITDGTRHVANAKKSVVAKSGIARKRGASKRRSA
ncbi:MAG: hypothetical protein ACKVS9_02815 [Phycisphaerae bacterium]